MKRLHVHIRVDDLNQSIQFYNTLFGDQPTVLKTDYAKWLLDDPLVNFAISPSSNKSGVDHIGIQTDDSDELIEISERLKAAGVMTKPQENASCCYAVSDKHWVKDPSGVQWETFHTHGESTTYGDDAAPIANPAQQLNSVVEPGAKPGACC